MMLNQNDIEWRDGVIPVSRRFNDPYFAMADGLSESRYVFLAGNGLPERFQPGFHIAELGFGTGLNLLATLQSWEASGNEGEFDYTAFERFPLDTADMARAHAAWPELTAYSRDLLGVWDMATQGVHCGPIRFRLVIGDARETVPRWTEAADAWYLDGFSPAKNPELWEAGLMQAVHDHTRTGGSFATYSAAGAIRHSLSDAGFDVSRQPGFGTKRHMSVGVLPPQTVNKQRDAT